MKLSHIELGATLFIPASFISLNAIVNEQKYPELQSLVIDFEDGLSSVDLEFAVKNVEEVLSNIKRKTPLLFIRARSVKQLEVILAFEGIEYIRGFVLAKFSLLNATTYLEILKDTNFLIMPSIEGCELFEQSKLLTLRDILLTNKERVLLVRFGLEDMLRQLSIWRKCDESIFDFASTSYVLGSFISIFKSSGFAISGGVYPCFKDEEGFKKDVLRDLKEGLFSKTIIHPSQISLAHEAYRVTQDELEKAQEIIKRHKEAVFSHKGEMAEISTMIPYAKEILQREEKYGIKGRYHKS